MNIRRPHEQRIIIVDCETTGLSHERSGMVELAAVAFIGDQVIGQSFNRRIQPHPMWVVEEEAVRKNGYDAASWGGQREDTVMLAFNAWLAELSEIAAAGPWTWGGASPEFDRRFVYAAGARAGVWPLESWFSHRVIDVTSVAWVPYLAGATDGRGMDALRRAAGLPPSPVHSALNDCFDTKLILDWMLSHLDWRP